MLSSSQLLAERKLSNNSTLKKEKTYSYLRKKNTALEQKSTLMDGSNGFGNRNNKPIIYIHLENAQGVQYLLLVVIHFFWVRILA